MIDRLNSVRKKEVVEDIGVSLNMKKLKKYAKRDLAHAHVHVHVLLY